MCTPHQQGEVGDEREEVDVWEGLLCVDEGQRRAYRASRLHARPQHERRHCEQRKRDAVAQAVAPFRGCRRIRNSASVQQLPQILPRDFEKHVRRACAPRVCEGVTCVRARHGRARETTAERSAPEVRQPRPHDLRLARQRRECGGLVRQEQPSGHEIIETIGFTARLKGRGREGGGGLGQACQAWRTE